MDDASDKLAEKVHALSDIELAVLICLVADQHCIIEADKQLLDAVEKELKLVASNVFGLTYAVLRCNEHTTLDDFGSGILVKNEKEDFFGSTNAANVNFSSLSGSQPPDSRNIANIVVARDLSRASQQVQIQALELIRGKRNFTRTAVHAAPKPFIFISLGEADTSRLTMHLNDQFFISHRHYAEDSLPNIEENEETDDDKASNSSVVHIHRYTTAKKKPSSVLLAADLTLLAKRVAEVKISSEVRAYLHNIIVFMRLHRAVAGGISALATRHFSILAHVLAPLHNIDYVTPSLVALAARKIYPHRIIITAPENERSMQWGSSLDAVKAVLDGVSTDDVVEEVLQSVEAPL